MSEMIFYERVVPLNDQVHTALKVRPVANFAFAAKANSVPLLATEFFECSREYPIVFALADSGLIPAVLLGLRDNENLFVDSAKKWRARYIPAFVRRYPFVPAKGPSGELLVCIDEASLCFSNTEGEPLFMDGKPTPTLQHAMNFLAEFNTTASATELLGKRLSELGLLRQADSVAQLNDGSEFRMNGLRVVDEAKFRALDKVTVQSLFAEGSLALIYAHLISLGNLAALVDKLSALKRTAPASPPLH